MEILEGLDPATWFVMPLDQQLGPAHAIRLRDKPRQITYPWTLGTVNHAAVRARTINFMLHARLDLRKL